MTARVWKAGDVAKIAKGRKAPIGEYVTVLSARWVNFDPYDRPDFDKQSVTVKSLSTGAIYVTYGENLKGSCE